MLIQIKIAKVNELVDVDVEALPPVSLQYAITYGLTQSFNDAHAAIARKNFETDAAFFAAVREKANKRIDQVLTGNVPGARAPVDPHAAKARKLAKELSDDEMTAALEYVMKKRAKAA
jgi:hypothetical protein